jgi:DNA-directed RNA polymerase specialized sigma subunit
VFPTTSEVVAIRPGDRAAAAAGTGWLQEYAATRDPALWERIILAYLGLADRLAMRYRHSRGTSCAGPVAGTPDRSLGELLADPGPREEPEDLLILASMVAALPDLERQIIIMRFFDELKQDAIAAKVGCSQMHVSRLMRRALARMRAELLVPSPCPYRPGGDSK